MEVFSGSEVSLDERDIEDNPTILSGDTGVKGIDSDNVAHVITCNTDNSLIDGFAIKLGNALIPIQRNDCGAGLLIQSGEIEVSDCTFVENYADNLGGAVYNEGTAVFTGCLFTLNAAQVDGGAIYNEQSDALFTDCVMSNNHATTQSGGAMYNRLSDPVLYRCTFSENTASTTGGAISNDNSNPYFESIVISGNNSGASGGGVYNLSSQSVFVNCLLSNNDVLGPAGSGGGLADDGYSHSTLTNCTITGNEAFRSGGCGGMHLNISDGTINNCIFWGNSDGGSSNFDETAQIQNAPSREFSISYSCIQGCNTFCTGDYATSHNTQNDPLIIPVAPYLDDGSAAINTGNNNVDIDANTPEIEPLPTTDLAGNSRIMAGTVDMGAYERQDVCSNGTPCNDGNPCTINDVCSNGVCKGEPVVCDQLDECKTTSCSPAGVEGNCDQIIPINEGGNCDDEDACTENDFCSNGACHPGDTIDCNDDDVCTDDSCHPLSGCQHTYNSEPCDDADACTENDFCSNGVCIPGDTIDCNDDDICTDDSCDPLTGCAHTFNTNPCDDGDACTENDFCSNGVCFPGSALDCNDDNVCTDDSCDPISGCLHTYNSDPCDDADACTENDFCSNGVCVPGDALDCNDDDVCTDDSCNPLTGCEHTFNTNPCDDGDACTENDFCTNGVCMPGSALDCNDDDVCTDDSCDPISGCLHTYNSDPCDDADACTENDFCSNGVCVPGDALDCNDDDVCTDDSCDPLTGCAHTFNTNPCDDGDACTENDFCSNGVCFPGSALDCNDDNVCTDDSCDSLSGCQHIYNSDPCDDADACTENDFCSNGVCVPGDALDCNDDDVCTDDSCDPLTGCEHTFNTNPCDDGDACTENDFCSNGVCVPGDALDCNDDNSCTDDSCDPQTGCQYSNNTGTCNDGNPCTLNDVCSNGICAGTPVDCSSYDGKCHTASCDPSGTNGNCNIITPANDGDPCNDDNPCTENDVCSDGFCAGIEFECPDPDPCNIAFCDPAGTNGNCNTVVPAHEGEPCNDTDMCTVEDACHDGACVGIVYDIDGDDIPNICDNCPTVYNPLQGDDCDVPPNVLCVKYDAIGTGDGSSWYNAFNRLQDALSVADASGGAVTEIWVAAGPWSYRPADDTYRRATFQLISGLGVYGGFAGIEQSRGERDLKKNITVLSGDIGIPGNISDNCYHVVTGSGADETAILENFVITQGNANGTPSAKQDIGGGLFYLGSYNDQTGPSIINCVFLANHAHESGGGVWTKTTPHKGVTLTNCVFLGNTTDGDGAGVSNPIGAIEITNCTFLNNTASNFGGGLYTGVSIYQGCPANSVITNSVFWNNHDQSGSDQLAQIYAVNTNCSPEKKLPTREAKPDPAIVYNCCIQGWTVQTWMYTGDDDLVTERSNFPDNPMFANSCGIDTVCGTADDDYRLTFGSPCLDSGSNGLIPQDISDLNSNGSTAEPIPYDLIGNQRVVHEVVDIGALEFKYDCNSNGIVDFQDIELGTSADCNNNTIPDECETDCNFNGIPDDCDLDAHTSEDCNSNGIPDECDIATGTSTDCNTNGIPDSCDILSGVIGSGWVCLADPCAIVTDDFVDCNSNSIPDECELGERFFILENGDITEQSRLLEFNLVNGASKVIINLPIGGNDRGLTVLPEQNDLLVTDYENLLIYRINSNNGNIVNITDISAEELPVLELAYDRHQNTLYGSVKYQGLHEIDLASGTLTHIMDLPYSLPTMDEWVCLAYDGFTRQLIGADRQEQIPYFVDPVTQTYSALPNSLDVGVMSDLAIDSASGLIYGTNQTGQIFRVDRVTGETTHVVTVHGVGFTVGIAAAFRTAVDCNANNVPDECDIAGSTSNDCNTNGFPDECEVLAGTANDINSNGIPDECDLDCNNNGIPDDLDIIFGTTYDCNNNLLDDNCEPDCNNTSVPDDCDVLAGTSEDCNDNLIPDECEGDCNSNGVPDDCDITEGTSIDCNANSIPDECDLTEATSADCNSNSIPDECDIEGTTSGDCNTNSIPDECDIATNFSQDCNTNGIPDSCDLSDGTSLDCNETGIPDSCEPMGDGDYDGNGTVSIDDYQWLADCLAGPGNSPSPASPECIDACIAVFDFDSDGNIDLQDFAKFQRKLQ